MNAFSRLEQILSSSEMRDRIPENVKSASENGRLHELILNKLPPRLQKVGAFDIHAALKALGEKIYTKRAEWSVVANGIEALGRASEE